MKQLNRILDGVMAILGAVFFIGLFALIGHLLLTDAVSSATFGGF